MVTNSIVIKDLGKRYNEKEVFSNMNLEVEKGDFISILGPNGCGKSTLIKSIAGLIDYSGHIKKFGSISLVSQNPQEMLLPWLTVKENIIFPMSELKIEQEFLEKLLMLTNLKDSESKYPYELSGGMQQILLIARALLHKSDIILLDEPSRSLDFFMKVKIQEKIHELWKEYRPTIIMVSHDIDEALFLSKKIMLFSNKPSQIQKIIESHLPEERSIDIMKTREFNNFRTGVMNEIFNI